jgi:hypothetical protein
MTVRELKARLSQILSAEEEADIDWSRVHRLSAALLDEVDQDAPEPCSLDLVRDYLGAVERRRQDAVFAHAQRSELAQYLRGSA